MADGNKTEEATPRRREKAREQGQVARSRDLPGVFAMVGVGGVLVMMAPSAVSHWGLLLQAELNCAAASGLDKNGPTIYWSSVELLRWMLPILLGGFVAALCGSLVQGGVNISPKALELQFNRFNPVSKLGQIFSPAGLSNLLKSLLPFGAILWVAISILRSNWESMVLASSLGLRALSSFVGSALFELSWKACLILMAWAGVDYFLIAMKMNSDLKMSKQEVREEAKETDGNPVIKGRIRQLQRQLRRRQSLKAAATATVIVTNPTHYAVALRYAEDTAAPVVVAKGCDLLAAKIRQIGRDNAIMLIENRPLAQALYKTVEIGDAIPAGLYQAVAEVLVIVFQAQAQLQRKQSQAGNQDRPHAQDPSSTQQGRNI